MKISTSLRSATVSSIALLASSAACSSTDGADEPSCTVEGTYSATSAKESGNCDAVYGTSSEAATIQFIKSNGSMQLVTQGLQGTCPVTVDGCKVTGACSITVGGAKGTYQTSFTFDAKGFSGISSYVLPQFVDNTGNTRAACNQTDRITATRR